MPNRDSSCRGNFAALCVVAYVARIFWPASYGGREFWKFNMEKTVKILSSAADLGVVCCDSADFRNRAVRRLPASPRSIMTYVDLSETKRPASALFDRLDS